MAREEAAHIHRVADSLLNAFARLIADAAREGQKALVLSRVIEASRLQDGTEAEFQASLAIARMQETLEETLPSMFLRLLEKSGTAEADHLAALSGDLRAAKDGDTGLSIGLNLRASHPAARSWVARHGGELITEITEESRKAVREVLKRAFNQEGFPPRTTAKLIQKSIGLTSRHADAVESLRRRLNENAGKVVHAGKSRIRVPASGMPQDRLERVVDSYADKLLRSRALTIARTETIAGANEGQRQLWTQAVERGFLTGNEKREWIATPGACPICGGLDGKTASLQGTFPGGLAGPPAHPRCRCSQGLKAKLQRPSAPAPLFDVGAPFVPPEAPIVPQVVEVVKKRAVASKVVATTPRYVTEGKRELQLAKDELDRFAEEYAGLANIKKPRIIQYMEGSLHGGNELGTYWSRSVSTYTNAGRKTIPKGTIRVRIDYPTNYGSWNIVDDYKLAPGVDTLWSTGGTRISTFRHEYGHHVHLGHLRQKSKAGREWTRLWDRLYNESAPAGSQYPYRPGEWIKRHISTYASTNERELFAEAFRVYTHPTYGQLGRPRLPRLIEDYFERHIGVRKVAQARVHDVPMAPRVPTVAPAPVSAPRPQVVETVTRGKKLSAADVQDIVARKARGESAQDIAKVYGLHPNYVRTVVKKYGSVATPSTKTTQTTQTTTTIIKKKMTAEDVVEIRRRRANGESLAQIAKTYGVDPGYIWQIVNRKIWKDVA